MRKHLSRRRFLQTTAAGATLVWSGRVSAQDKQTSANERIHVGVIGVAGQGEYDLNEVARELRRFDGTRVLVTHDAVDAMALGDRLVVLEGGRVVQAGTAEDVRRRPRSRYAAELVGVNVYGWKVATFVVTPVP